MLASNSSDQLESHLQPNVNPLSDSVYPGTALALSACGPGSGGQLAKPSSPDQIAGDQIAGDPQGNAIPGEPTDSHGRIGNTVYFATDAYDLSPDAQSALQRQADWLKQYPMRTFTVEGHADERGTREYNLALGDRRANSVANYFVALGIDKSRISVISYGKERPLCFDAKEACWSQNRRGVTAINQ